MRADRNVRGKCVSNENQIQNMGVYSIYPLVELMDSSSKGRHLKTTITTPNVIPTVNVIKISAECNKLPHPVNLIKININ